MTADHSRVFAVFEDARELAGAERERFLEEECAGDADLRREVENLLAADAGALEHDFLFDQPAPGPDAFAGQADTDDVLDVAAGAVEVSGYRVLRRLASGGMGTVYVAEQAAPRRVVALKVLKPAYCNGRALRRFLVESEILGRLKHEGIAEVYGAGAHPFRSGAMRFDLPWYAMEFLEGAKTIVQDAHDRGLDVRQRFRLFAEVCDAVQHAHSMGVIHRDLKPANVLVDRHGKPKIIDFGIARAVSAEHDASTLHTRTGELVGTLRYMAPEQLDGDPSRIDVRTDVYALGVILYELLTGRAAREIDDRSITEAIRLLRDREPEAPSRVDPRLRGEPEWIVLKAIEKDASRRYRSAAALREDVIRYLAHEAVEAGPPSGVYRASKFVRRHRFAVIALGAVFASLAVGLVSTLAALSRALDAEKVAGEEAERATSEAKRATDEATVSNQIVRLFERTFEAARTEERGLDLKVVDALDTAAADVSAELKDRPDLGARLQSRFSQLYTSLGDEQKSRTHFEETVALMKAAGLDRTLEGIANRRHLIEMRMRVGDFEGSQALLDETMPIARLLLPEDHPELIDLGYRQGILHLRTGKPKDAEPLIREAAEARARVVGENDADTLGYFNALNVALQEQGRFADAEPIARRVEAAMPAAIGPEKPLTLMARANLAALLQESVIGKHEEARDLLIENLECYERTVGLDYRDAIVCRCNLASARLKCGEAQAAIEDYADAVARANAKFGASHPLTLQITLAAARLALTMNQVERAESTLDGTLAAAAGTLPADNTVVAALHATHGEVLRRLGRAAEGRAELVAAYEILVRELGETAPETRKAKDYLSRFETD